MPLNFIQLNMLSLLSFVQVLRVLIEFVVIWVIVYYILKIVRNNSRTVQIFKGVIVVIALRFFANSLGLKTLTTLLDFFIQSGIVIVVIIFQPEIRAMLERLGKTSVFSALHALSQNEKEKLIDELVETARVLSKRRIGALITLEQGHSLSDYIRTGTPINSTVTADLLCSIFVTSTPLHDGAVIIQGDRIACASAYFPPTDKKLPTKFGARHRAAIGISEITDSITIVVSEETGTISIAEGGKLKEIHPDTLRSYLNLVIKNAESEVSESVAIRKSRKVNLSRMNVDPLQVERVEKQSKTTPTNTEKIITKAEKEHKKTNSDFSKLTNIFKRRKSTDKAKNEGKDIAKTAKSKSGKVVDAKAEAVEDKKQKRVPRKQTQTKKPKEETPKNPSENNGGGNDAKK